MRSTLFKTRSRKGRQKNDADTGDAHKGADGPKSSPGEQLPQLQKRGLMRRVFRRFFWAVLILFGTVAFLFSVAVVTAPLIVNKEFVVDLAASVTEKQTGGKLELEFEKFSFAKGFHISKLKLFLPKTELGYLEGGELYETPVFSLESIEIDYNVFELFTLNFNLNGPLVTNPKLNLELYSMEKNSLTGFLEYRKKNFPAPPEAQTAPEPEDELRPVIPVWLGVMLANIYSPVDVKATNMGIKNLAVEIKNQGGEILKKPLSKEIGISGINFLARAEASGFSNELGFEASSADEGIRLKALSGHPLIIEENFSLTFKDLRKLNIKFDGTLKGLVDAALSLNEVSAGLSKIVAEQDLSEFAENYSEFSISAESDILIASDLMGVDINTLKASSPEIFDFGGKASVAWPENHFKKLVVTFENEFGLDLGSPFFRTVTSLFGVTAKGSISENCRISGQLDLTVAPPMLPVTDCAFTFSDFNLAYPPLATVKDFGGDFRLLVRSGSAPGDYIVEPELDFGIRAVTASAAGFSAKISQLAMTMTSKVKVLNGFVSPRNYFDLSVAGLSVGKLSKTASAAANREKADSSDMDQENELDVDDSKNEDSRNDGPAETGPAEKGDKSDSVQRAGTLDSNSRQLQSPLPKGVTPLFTEEPIEFSLKTRADEFDKTYFLETGFRFSDIVTNKVNLECTFPCQSAEIEISGELFSFEKLIKAAKVFLDSNLQKKLPEVFDAAVTYAARLKVNVPVKDLNTVPPAEKPYEFYKLVSPSLSVDVGFDLNRLELNEPKASINGFENGFTLTLKDDSLTLSNLADLDSLSLAAGTNNVTLSDFRANFGIQSEIPKDFDPQKAVMTMSLLQSLRSTELKVASGGSSSSFVFRNIDTDLGASFENLQTLEVRRSTFKFGRILNTEFDVKVDLGDKIIDLIEKAKLAKSNASLAASKTKEDEEKDEEKDEVAQKEVEDKADEADEADDDIEKSGDNDHTVERITAPESSKGITSDLAASDSRQRKPLNLAAVLPNSTEVNLSAKIDLAPIPNYVPQVETSGRTVSDVSIVIDSEQNLQLRTSPTFENISVSAEKIVPNYPIFLENLTGSFPVDFSANLNDLLENFQKNESDENDSFEDVLSRSVNRRRLLERASSDRSRNLNRGAVEGVVNDKPIQISRIRVGGFDVSDINVNASLDATGFYVDNAEFVTMGGVGSASLFVALTPMPSRVSTSFHLAGVNTEEIPYRLRLDEIPKDIATSNFSMNSHIDFLLHDQTLNGDVDITEIGRDQAAYFLDLLDPKGEDSNINNARLGLKLGYPKGIKIPIRNGLMDIELDIRSVGVPLPIPDVKGFSVISLIENVKTDKGL